MKKIITLFLVIAMMVASVIGMTSCGKTEYTKDNTEIVIGVSGPLTGGAAVYGIAVRNAAQMAVDEINANGGLDGIKFKFIASDDKHDPTNVTTSYSSMYEAGMQISLGCVTTKPGLEFKELSKDDNVFVLTPSATGDLIPEYDNAFQMCFADSNQGGASAEYFNTNFTGKKIGVFYKSDDEYSKGIRDQFLSKLSADLKANLKEASFKGKESDFNTQVNTLKECDVIFMPIYYDPASQFMVAGKDTIKASAVYFGCDGLDGIDAIKGFDINSIPQEVSYLSHFNSGATTGAAADFIKAYNDKYDEDKEPLNQFGAAAYDCVYAIFEALKVAKANGKTVTATTSASDFCEILKEVFTSETFEFKGVTGKAESDGYSRISWTDDGFVNKVAVKYIVKESSAK